MHNNKNLFILAVLIIILITAFAQPLSSYAIRDIEEDNTYSELSQPINDAGKFRRVINAVLNFFTTTLPNRVENTVDGVYQALPGSIQVNEPLIEPPISPGVPEDITTELPPEGAPEPSPLPSTPIAEVSELPNVEPKLYIPPAVDQSQGCEKVLKYFSQNIVAGVLKTSVRQTRDDGIAAPDNSSCVYEPAEVPKSVYAGITAHVFELASVSEAMKWSSRFEGEKLSVPEESTFDQETGKARKGRFVFQVEARCCVKLKKADVIELLSQAVSRVKADPGGDDSADLLANTCSQAILKFYPLAKISAALGKKIATAEKSGQDGCELRFHGSGASITVAAEKYEDLSSAVYEVQRYREYNSVAADIGDEGYVSPQGGGRARKQTHVFKIDTGIVSGGISQPQTEQLLKYAVSQLKDSKTGIDCQTAKIVVNSLSEFSLRAGKRANDRIPVEFVDEDTLEVIKGKNLQCVKSIEVVKGQFQEGMGIDGQRAVYFTEPKANADGTKLEFYVRIKPTALPGYTIITLKSAGDSVEGLGLLINISGTQYLNRRFANSKSVKFYGWWPEANDEVKILADATEEGVAFMTHGAYKPLHIFLTIFENKYWDEQAQYLYCTPKGYTNYGFGVGGCSPTTEPGIYLSDFSKYMKYGVVHESAHKLHQYYKGNYRGTALISKLFGFQGKWDNIVGDVTSCRYLPIQNGSWTNEKDPFIPHCGFVRAYGATNLITYAEDVATFTELEIMSPDNLLKGEGPYDLRYGKKQELLKEYGFIP